MTTKTKSALIRRSLGLQSSVPFAVQICPRKSVFHLCSSVAVVLAVFAGSASARAQLPEERVGEVVPRDVREMYDRGLQFLASTQTEQGNWTDGEQGPGITGLALMAFLASGE